MAEGGLKPESSLKTQSHMDATKGHETVKRREKRARQVKVCHTSGSVHSGTLGRWIGFCSALLSHTIDGQVLGRA